MNVLLLSPLPPPSGGIARWTQRFLTWGEEKIDVTVVNTALVGDRAGEAGIKKRMTVEAKRALLIINNTRNRLKRKPDIMHLNTSCSKQGIFRDWICVGLADKRGVPIVVHCHCNIEDQIGKGKLPKKIFEKIADKAKVVLVLNQKSRDYVEKIVPGKARICPNFVMTDQIAKEHKVNDHFTTGMYVGDVRFSKGSDDIYELAEQCQDKKFIVIGSVTDEMKKIKKPDNVIIMGRLEAVDVYRQLDEADVFIFPSLTEGFSNALLEAMARGVPVIATDVGANKDMIEERGGVIVPVHDVEAMKAALYDMEPKEKRKKMSEWNINKVKKYYEYNKVLQELMHIYEEII